MQARTLPAVVVGLSSILTGQQVRELTLPVTATNAASTHADVLPFQPNPGGMGWRLQSCYERENFLDLGVHQPVDIQRLRLRGRGSSPAAWCPNVAVRMSTARVPARSLSTFFTSNHGPDLATVFSGGVTAAAVAGSISPGPYFVDLQLTTPFRYDPYAGDLLIEVSVSNTGITGGPAARTEYMGSGSGRGRMVGGDLLGRTATIDFPGTMVAHLDYTLPAGFASPTPYGRGCPQLAMSVHETFDPAARPFDLAGGSGTVRRLRFVAAPGGYVLGQVAGPAWHVPSAPDLALRDDQCSAPQTLPFAFPHLQRDGSPNGTTQIVICSNGYVWLDPTQTRADFSPTVAELLGEAARIAGLWVDLAPNLGGSVHFDVDPAAGAAYATWLGVPQYTASGGSGAHTFQVALFSDGSFEMRWADCGPFTVTSVIGWSPGGGARWEAPTDLSAVSGLRLGGETPLSLDGVDRPVLGTTFHQRIGFISAGSALGALCFGFDNTPIDLSPLGMPGCRRWSGWDVVQMVQPAGSATVITSLPLPYNPALAGVEFYGQAVMFVRGLNPMGLVVSNGLSIRLGVN